jgi:hypothetical protein
MELGGGAAMPSVVVYVWQNREGSGDPDVEVRIPASMAKWVPRMMKFIPKKTMEANWGEEVDFAAMFEDIVKLVNEAVEGGPSELLTVKTKDAYIKVVVEK